MNKKKALFTSLAALALASTAQVGFAEEVEATVAEPVVAEVPVTEEVAQDAPVAEVVAEEPVAEVVTEEASAETAPEVTTRAVEEEVSVTTFAAASAGEQATPAMDVQAIANGDYSSVEGEWVNEKGETLKIAQAGPVISADHISFVSHYELTGQTGSTLKNISDSSYTEAYDAVLSGEVQGMYPKTVHINYIPQGSSFGWLSYLSQNVETVTATEDWIVWMPSSEGVVPDLSHILEYRVYKRVVQAAAPTTSEVVAQPVVEEVATPVSQVNVDAVLAGDFSSVAGLWQNGFVDWAAYEVFPDGTLHYIGTDGHVTVMRLALPTLKENGKLEGGIVTVDGGFVGAAYSIMPAGVDASTNMGQDSSDQSRDRMGFGQSFDPSEPRIFYYRVVQAAVQETPTPASTGLIGTWAGESAEGLPTHVAQVDQIVIAEDGSYTIYQTNRNTGVKEEKVGQITSMEQIGENRYLITETGGLSGIYSPGFVTANKVETGLEIFADKFGVFYIITDVQTGEKTETDPIRYLTRVTPAVETPVVTETAAPTTSEVVHVPLTAKTEATVEQATPAKPSYQRSEKAQSEKGILPSTGEVTSVLGAIGASLSAFGLAGLRRRK